MRFLFYFLSAIIIIFIINTTVSAHGIVDKKNNTTLQFGGTANDYMAYREWSSYWKYQNPLQVMKNNGFNWIRVGVLTTSSQLLAATPYQNWPSLGWQNEFWCSREFAERVLHEAAQYNLNQSVFFYFSDRATHAGQQDGPAEWLPFNLEQTAAAIEHNCYETANYFKMKGLNVKIYEMGNEIEYGICSYYPGGKITQWNGQGAYLNYLRDSVWSKEVVLLKAAIRGTKRADSTAQIKLHISSVGWFEGIHQAFYQYIIDNGVPFDFIGLSYYTSGYPPGSPSPTQVTFGNFLQLCSLLTDQTGKKIIISEFSYPSSYVSDMGPIYPGYPFTEQGQALYVRDFIRICKPDTNIYGIFYFYPDYQIAQYSISEVLGSYGLFHNDSTYKQAMTAIKDELLNVDGQHIASPLNFHLYQNYPNPFNPKTTISFNIPTSEFVTVKIINILGEEVETLIEEHRATGEYKIEWHSENFPSGVYFYQMRSGKFVETKKLILLK
ncbi:MAG: glycosyl hydrolase 53 family protein [Bacteroidota bacterium]|nr:glycosyl hydrolase 53 family protein [Bacteroidota bacterium]